jgi:hypothetical protein
MKKNAVADPAEPQKRVRTRILSSLHIIEPGRFYRCGCAACLQREGLEIVYVVGEDGKEHRMLVDWFSPRVLQLVKQETLEFPNEGNQNEEE